MYEPKIEKFLDRANNPRLQAEYNAMIERERKVDALKASIKPGRRKRKAPVHEHLEEESAGDEPLVLELNVSCPCCAGDPTVKKIQAVYDEQCEALLRLHKEDPVAASMLTQLLELDTSNQTDFQRVILAAAQLTAYDQRVIGRYSH